MIWDYQWPEGRQVREHERSLARAMAESLSFWSRIFGIPVRLLQIPLETLAFGLNRITETAGNSFSPPSFAPVLPPPDTALAETAPESPAVVRAPRMELLTPPDQTFQTNPDGLRGDSLKLVRSRIVFVKRPEEFAFPAQEDLIADDLDPGVFEAWKIAEFMQRLTDPAKAPEVPPGWSVYLPATCRHKNGRLRRFPPGDLKYLRVYFEVLRYSRRESLHFHERQLRLLREIANSFENHAKTK